MMMLTACLKRLGFSGEVRARMPRRSVLCLFFTASLGLWLWTGPATATVDTTVRVDFLSPTLADDQLLGTFQFPGPGEQANVTFLPGCNGNCVRLQLTDGGFVLHNNSNSQLTIASNIQALLKLTFQDINNIGAVVAGGSSGFNLPPNAIQFGSNFAQVQLAGTTAAPGSAQEFPITFLSTGVAPLPAPASLPLLAAGLVALVLVRRATGRGGRPAA